MKNFNRRRFLMTSGLGGLSGLVGSVIPTSVQAISGDYRALVCVFLKGGLDHADTILPIDPASYDQLLTVRPNLLSRYAGQGAEVSRARADLLPLQPDNGAQFGGREFGLPPNMSNLADLFNSGDAAIVGNVGPLIEPTDRTSFEQQAVPLPTRLFSHNDQQSTWMALGVEGSQVGWGGQFADAILAANPGNNPLYTAVSADAPDTFLASESSRQFIVSAGNFSRRLELVESDFLIGGNNPRFDAPRQAIQAFFDRPDFGHGDLYRQDYARISAAGVANARAYDDAVADFDAPFPNTRLGQQLQVIAQTIAASGPLGVNRQVFYASLGGFDTHSNQADDLPPLQTQISEAFAAFRDALVSINRWNETVLFTASDFGRTTIDNGDGTDHGWGGHHFVLGGSINGRTIYGEIPSPDVSTAQYTSKSGRLIPAISIEQYGASLGRWLNIDEAELASVFPNLGNFATPDLGFI